MYKDANGVPLNSKWRFEKNHPGSVCSESNHPVASVLCGGFPYIHGNGQDATACNGPKER
jgi:hypothetical protein